MGFFALFKVVFSVALSVVILVVGLWVFYMVFVVAVDAFSFVMSLFTAEENERGDHDTH